MRDATVQRFEACWKALKKFLEEEEGLVCNSPKACFRAAFDVALISEDQTSDALAMTDERNLISHAYIEAVAERVFRNIPGFTTLMEDILSSMRTRLDSPGQ